MNIEMTTIKTDPSEILLTPNNLDNLHVPVGDDKGTWEWDSKQWQNELESFYNYYKTTMEVDGRKASLRNYWEVVKSNPKVRPNFCKVFYQKLNLGKHLEQAHPFNHPEIRAAFD